MIIPVLEREPSFSSDEATIMKISQTSTSEMPAKAERDAQTMVAWNVIFEIRVRLARINRPMVTGIGKILDELIDVLPFEPPPLLLLLLFATQNPLSSINGGVQTDTHLLPYA